VVKHYQNINSVKYVNSTFQLYIINKGPFKKGVRTKGRLGRMQTW